MQRSVDLFAKDSTNVDLNVYFVFIFLTTKVLFSGIALFRTSFGMDRTY